MFDLLLVSSLESPKLIGAIPVGDERFGDEFAVIPGTPANL